MVAFDAKSTEGMAMAIVCHYRQATSSQRREGRAWYPSAERAAIELSKEFGLTRAMVAGFIAALSPRQRWAVNLNQARQVAESVAAGNGVPAVGTMDTRRKLSAIAEGRAPLKVLGGKKVRSFYRNLMGDTAAVTVDRWALRAAIWKGGNTEANAVVKDAQYEPLSEAYRAAAAMVGETPRAIQAIVWIVLRGSAA